MPCPNCGSPNVETARFCGSCGERLTATCPHCRADVAPDRRFCNACGGLLPHAAGPDEQAAADGSGASLPSERRLVSVLFVDLEEFTTLAEFLDPEDVRNLQSQYFEGARSIVARYGGTVEKFIGDAVMAVWGTAAAHEDDGERAVRAALEILAAVSKLRGATSGRRLSARAAVASGEAAVTLGVEGQGIVAGDLVNTAARLQAAAPSNGVLVDDLTRRLVGDAVSFAASGPTTLKGRSALVTTWQAEGLADGRLRGRAAGHAGPFVGRGREFAELTELWHRTVATGRSRIVSVLGIAGIGKSRLVWEFERHMDSLPEPLAHHVGRAPSYGEGITFAPLAEMVRRRARISEGTESEVARLQLEATLAEFVPDEVERLWMKPRLATLLDPGSDVAYERDDLFAAWRRFFERVSEWAPVLLVFEDLQWADPALLDFIDYVGTWSRAHPILIVTLARPELLDARPTWGAGHHSFTAIRLEPLLDEEMGQLLTALAPTLPPFPVQRIVERAGGVPLYAVEVLRMLVDRGQARTGVRGLELLAPLAEVEIPETLHLLVSARIDAQPPAERGMLLNASVLGRRFSPDALAVISRLDAKVARDRIASLIRRELVTVDDEPRSPGRGQLSFVQDVVRSVAYRTLSRRERRSLHLAAADYLETLHDVELVEAIAEHLVEAHGAIPDHPDASVAAVRAVSALRGAATRALALRVPARALDHLQRALELVDDDVARATLWQDAAVAARGAARFDLAETYLRQLIDWHMGNGSQADAARARAQLASLLLATERHGSAIEELEAALEDLGGLPPDATGAELNGQLARAFVLVGEDQQALDWADRTIDAARELGLPGVAVDALITRGTASMRLGDNRAGLADLDEAVADAERLDLVGAQLRALNNRAWLTVPDDPHAALETARTGLELATRMGVGDMALQLAEVVCAVALQTGDWDVALAVYDETRQRPQSPALRILFAASEATLRALRGEDAGAVLDALEPLDPATDPQVLSAIDQARAWMAFLDGRLEDAQRLAELAAGRSFGAERHAVMALAIRACLWLEDEDGVASGMSRLSQFGVPGRAAAATELTARAGARALAHDAAAPSTYDEAVSAWRSLRLPLHLALCLTERHRLVRGAEGVPGSADLEEAEAILEGLNAAGVLRAIRLARAQLDRVNI
jgi:class 3 adenylate cyclase/tetratricopeptide (TPR) repeat protein